ncbi:hypothetical protein GCM10010254_44650 [Streptomyces chromofuscus]|nr:hypothetical protein GCM10010254_44650 [Streptomyces chromofuscus]
MPSGTNDPPEKATKPFGGIVAALPPSRQLHSRRPVVDCATLRALRFCRTTPRPKRARFPDIGDEAPGVRVRYNDRPAYRERYDKRITGRDRSPPVRRRGTRLSGALRGAAVPR